MEETSQGPQVWKIKDNKAVIQNLINRARYKNNPYSRLIRTTQIEEMVQLKMKHEKCSELEATEILKKEIKAEIAELEKSK